MSEGMNKVFLMGNLGADPELRMTQAGTAVLKLRLATNESWRDSAGVRREATHWHDAVVWGRRAEALAGILHKGRRVMVEGRLRTSSWDAQDGTKRYRTEVQVRELWLLGGSSSRDAHPAGGGLRTSRDIPFGEPASSSETSSPLNAAA